MDGRYQLDQIDLELLYALQVDAREPMNDIAARVGISAPAAYRRVKRLREIGAIDREVALANPKSLGWPLSMVVLITLERERTDIIDRLIQKFSHVPQIVEAWYVTGEHDFALRIVARDMEQFEQLTRDALYSDENIRSFKTLVVMRTVKPLSAIPAYRPH